MKLNNELINFINKNCINHQIFFTKNICGDEMQEVYRCDGVTISKVASYGTCYTTMPSKEAQLWNKLFILTNNNSTQVKDDDAYFEILGLNEKEQEYIKNNLDGYDVLIKEVK